MIDKTRRLKVMAIDAKIRVLQEERESILHDIPLTSKEHLEFYHG